MVEGGTRRARLDRSEGATFHPGARPAGWTGRRYHLGDNNKAFDVEVYAIHQALRLFGARDERDQPHGVSDSTAALSRAQTDRSGPGQAFARAIIEVAERLQTRGCAVTLRWTPAHKGFEANEMADEYAEAAVESKCHVTDRRFLREANLAHLTRRLRRKPRVCQ